MPWELGCSDPRSPLYIVPKDAVEIHPGQAAINRIMNDGVRPPSRAQSFLARLQEISDQNVQTAIRKNADYATSEDPFANFRASEALGVSTARGILVRVSDKLARAANLLDRPPEVTEESLDDTLADASNYLNILRVFLEFERDG